MNAAEQAKSLEVTSKIASVVNLFKSEFPDAKADLQPWHNDPDTLELVDPDSIDIGFHLPGWSRKIQSRSLLVQIRFHEDPITSNKQLIGIQIEGFDYRGKAWRFSTVENWQVVGETQPVSEVQEKLKHFCRQVFELFNS